MFANVTLENETLNAFLVPPQLFIVGIDLNLANALKAYCTMSCLINEGLYVSALHSR